jgi:CBS domain-containing protein
MTTSKTEDATDNKSGTIEENISEESQPEELSDATDSQDEKKAETEEEATAATEPKAELNGEPEAEVTVEAEDETEAEAEDDAEADPEAKVNGEPEAEAKVEAEEDTEAEDEPKTEEQTEAEAKAEAKAKAQAEEEAKIEEEAEADTEPETEVNSEPEAGDTVEDEEKIEERAKDETKAEAEVAVEAAAEEKAETEEEIAVTESDEEPTGEKISETIKKMTKSSAVLPGGSGKATIANNRSSSKICAKDIMQKELAWATSEERVHQALTKMQQQDSGYIMIGRDGALEGIVSKSDISGATSIYLRPIFEKWHGPGDDATLQIKLKWIMSKPVRTVSPDTPLATIMDNMTRFGGRGLPVVDEHGKVLGLVTVFDIFQAFSGTSEDNSDVGKTAQETALV